MQQNSATQVRPVGDTEHGCTVLSKKALEAEETPNVKIGIHVHVQNQKYFNLFKQKCFNGLPPMAILTMGNDARIKVSATIPVSP